MANEIDALLNVKDASGVLNEIYPITKKENVQGLAELVSNAVSGKADKTDLDSYCTEETVDTKLENYLPNTGGIVTGSLVAGESNDNVEYAMGITKEQFIASVYNLNTNKKSMIRFLGSTIDIEIVDGRTTNFLYITPSGISTDSSINIVNNGQLTHKLYVDNAVSTVKPKAHKVTLTTAGWDSTAKTQTVNVTGVLADETKQLILPMPATASMSAYTEAGIMCTGQAAGKLTFTADTVPTAAIEVYVTISDVNYS